MISLSVIIPTRNRCEVLGRALDSITKQTYEKEYFEVIVIDNGSTDQTKEVVLSYQGLIPHLTYYYDNRPGLHVGRHQGYKLSKGDILVYADDDIEAFPTWLEGIWESFQDESVALVGGKNYPKYEGKPPFWVLEKWYKLCSYGHCFAELSLIDFGDEVLEIPATYVFGCNFSIRRRILNETKGFHPDGMPFERIEFRGDGETFVDKYIIEHHYKTIYNPKASVFHLVPKDRMTIDYFKKRAFCQGVEMSYVDLRYGKKSVVSESMIQRLKSFLSRRLRDTVAFQILDQLQNTDIDKEIDLSRRIGYDYHQKKYNRSAELRDWVHKDNYMD